MIEGAKTEAAKNVIRQVDELKSIIKGMRARQEYPQHVKEVEAEGILAIKKELLTASKAEVDRINTRIAQLEKEYKKALRESDRSEIDSIITRYHGMTDKELNAEALKVITNPLGHDPVLMDNLSAELRSRKSDNHSILRDKLVNADYLRPYLHSDEGKALLKEKSFYENAKPGLFLIEGTNIMGKPELCAADVQGLYDE